MSVLIFPEYRPDVSDFQGQFTKTALNVLPRGDGYGPMKDAQAFTSALPAACRGMFYARKTDGSIVVFAGTSVRLYKLNNTDFTFTDVSKGAVDYSGVASGDQWQFAQFGNFVIAVQANTVPQVFDLTSSTAFADLGGTPPQARYISIVGRFVVLSGLLSNPYRIQWSGLNATTTWTSGVNSSDFQDFPDGGLVRGVAGGEYGVIFQDQTVRRMTYAPGSPVIFQIDRIAEDKGIFAPLSLVRSGDKLFMILNDGFHVIQAGGYPTPIGKERIDRTFFADIDTGALGLCLGMNDPKGSRVFWTYKSLAGTAGQFDKIICYDWALDRFAPIAMSGEYVTSLAKPGLTLEGLDTISSSIDALPFSLDDVSTAALAAAGIAGPTHKIGFLSGSNLEATVETAEQGGNGRRMFVRGFRVITDAPALFGSVSARENPQASQVYGTETAVDQYGICPQNVSTRYTRGRVRIPSGTAWNYVSGVEPDISVMGLR